jgi:integrase
MARSKRSFGGIRELPSGRFQANYTGPDTRIYKADRTFLTRLDAEAWLTDRHREISRGEWTPEGTRKPHSLTFGVYAERWLEARPLKPRTRAHYRSLLDQQILPRFETVAIRAIEPDDVRTWHAALGTDHPTLRAHAYSLLRTVLATAVQDQVISVNPCHIRGAGNARRVKKIRPATLPELEVIVTAMPARLRCMVLLASWCALRFGELIELRRKDVDLKHGQLRIRRAAVRADGKAIVGTPKSDAGTRDVAIPPHLLPLLKTHLADHAQPGPAGLMFPAEHGGHLAPSTLYRPYYTARQTAGRKDLRFHDLRHTGAVLAAATGATLAELMGRLGHSSPGAALRYQHAAAGRDQEIAKALSALVEAKPV